LDLQNFDFMTTTQTFEKINRLPEKLRLTYCLARKASKNNLFYPAQLDISNADLLNLKDKGLIKHSENGTYKFIDRNCRNQHRVKPYLGTEDDKILKLMLEYNFHYRFPKFLIEKGEWANWPPRVKAIFPVIAVFANFRGESFPSQDRIAELAGLGEKRPQQPTVSKAIKFLLNNSLIEIASRIKKGNQTFGNNLYQLRKGLIRPKKYFFQFYRNIITIPDDIEVLPCWNRLSDCARALYPVLRYLAFENGDEERYFVRYQINEACRLAGIHRNSFWSAQESLLEHGLVDKADRKGLNVEQFVYVRGKGIIKPILLKEKPKKYQLVDLTIEQNNQKLYSLNYEEIFKHS